MHGINRSSDTTCFIWLLIGIRKHLSQAPNGTASWFYDNAYQEALSTKLADRFSQAWPARGPDPGQRSHFLSRWIQYSLSQGCFSAMSASSGSNQHDSSWESFELIPRVSVSRESLRAYRCWLADSQPLGNQGRPLCAFGAKTPQIRALQGGDRRGWNIWQTAPHDSNL